MKNAVVISLFVFVLSHYCVVAGDARNSSKIDDRRSNDFPVVSITNPLQGSSFKAGSLISVHVQASDADGHIRKVEFYNHGIKFSEDSTLPYEYSDSAVEEGQYVLTAKAFDNNGDSTVSDTVKITVTGCSGTGRISAEGFAIIEGSRVTDLLNHPFFPNDPIIVTEIDKLEYGPDLGNHYGVRLRGYICAPQTGNYIFRIASDDRSELWLSTDESPSNKIKIALVDPWVIFRAWNVFPSQRSAPIKLVRGARYYIETLHKQYTSFNHLSVAWTLPNGSFEGAIPGKRLSPFLNPPAEIPARARTGGPLDFPDATGNIRSLHVTLTKNPSQDDFTLSIRSETAEPLILTVSGSSGTVIERRAGIPANSTVRFGTKYKPGLYFAEIRQGAETQYIKLIKL
jgi:hypothetical protein